MTHEINVQTLAAATLAQASALTAQLLEKSADGMRPPRLAIHSEHHEEIKVRVKQIVSSPVDVVGSDADVIVCDIQYSFEHPPERTVVLAFGNKCADSVVDFMATQNEKMLFCDQEAAHLWIAKVGESFPSTVHGMVDLQVNGYKGISFSSPELTVEQCTDACSGILDECGVAAFLPTVVTASLEVYQHVLPILVAVIESTQFNGKILGLHLEGPFISAAPGARGCHEALHVRPCTAVEVFDQLIALAGGHVRVITIAADSPGAVELTQRACALGIRVALGHHLATAGQLDAVARAGASHLTHLGNGIPLSVHRHENPMLAGLGNDQLASSFIADGFHLPAQLLRVMIRCKSFERSFAVSDMTSLTGMPPGEYTLFGNPVVAREDGQLSTPEGYLAGSSSPMIDIASFLAREVLPISGGGSPIGDFPGCSDSLQQLLSLTVARPLQELGLSLDCVVRSIPERLIFVEGVGVFKACT